jgi:integrase
VPAVSLSRVGARVAGSGPGGEDLATGTWQRLEALPDPRSPQGQIYPLACLIAVAVCAFTAAGNDRFTAAGQWIRRASQRVEAISQPGIRKAALRYLTTVAATRRPATAGLRADSLIIFAEYLAASHPEVRSLTQLTRAHVEGFLAYNHKRPWRGRVARDQPVAQSVSKTAVIDLRCFLDDLALWGWAERPPGRLLFPADVPRLDKPLPRALTPDADRDLMAAIGRLADPFACTGLTLLRGTGIRLGELLDLELDCVWDSASHGSWLKVPLGKLATERTVPLDEATLAALDEWIAQRGPQRALPHPRLNRPADFLFTQRGRRLTAYRLRHGLDDAAAAAGLRGRDGQALHVTPHQLRHTYATSLVNAGMSLQALMALLGHYVGDLCQVDHVVVRYRRAAAAGERLSSWPISAQVWPWSRAA